MIVLVLDWDPDIILPVPVPLKKHQAPTMVSFKLQGFSFLVISQKKPYQEALRPQVPCRKDT
jgi:hypothetical protein